MDNIEINLNEISPIEDMKIDENKLQDVCVSFGEVIYVDKEDITDHDKLKNLDYEHSGHIGFASSEALSNVEERVKSLEEIGIPEDGLTPYIGENGNWFIGEEDTGVQAEGQDGKDGTNGVDGVGIATVSQGEAYENNGYTITPITFTKTDDTFHTFAIKAKDGKSENLELYATKEYVEGLNESTNEEIESAKTIAQEYTNQKAEELNAEIVKKANQSDMETALSKKADITYVDNKVSQEVSSVQTDLNNYKSTNDSAVKSNSDAIGILNGNSITEGSVDYKVNKAINEFAQAVTSNDTIDTFAEVISYVATHGEEFSELVGEVDKNTKSVETLNGADNVVGSVDYKIKNAISNENLSQYATDSELKGVSDRVKVIEEDYALDSDLGELSTQVGAIDERVTALEESGNETPSGEPLVASGYVFKANTSVTITKITGATSIDWGDGSPIEDISNLSEYTHTYVSTGSVTANIYGNITRVKGFFQNTLFSKVIIPNTATSIDASAFRGATALSDIYIPCSVTEIGNYAFGSCKGLTQISIPYSIKTMGSGVFEGCSALTGIQLPAIKTIPASLFASCSKLKSINIPTSVASIGPYAFEYCSELEEVTIPALVTTISSNAFTNTPKLLRIEFNGAPASSVSSTAFSTSVKLIVPSAYLNDYKTNEKWTAYASQIDSYALVGELPENEDVSLPIATSETLGGVKVGAGLSIEEDGTLQSNAVNYIDTSIVSPNVEEITESGLNVYFEEVEIETEGSDGNLKYHRPYVYLNLPIVAGDGISMNINDRGGAEIGNKLSKINAIFAVDNSRLDDSDTSGGLYCISDGTLYYGEDNNEINFEFAHHVPLVAGNGIKIEGNTDGKAEISADGLATESYVDTKVANLVNSAPETLNTLSELATAIQNHEDEYDALLETVGKKANASELSAVAFTGNYQDLDDTPVDLQDASIIFTSAPLEIRAIDEYGIHINLPEIEIEKIDGSYNYCSGVGSIPIVAGSGISITKNDSGKAEIAGTDIICYNLIYGASNSADFVKVSFSLPTKSTDTPTTLKGINTLLRSMYSFYNVVYPATGALRNSGKVYTVCGIAPASSSGLYAVVVNPDSTSSGDLFAKATWAPLADNGTTTVYAMRNGITHTNQ